MGCLSFIQRLFYQRHSYQRHSYQRHSYQRHSYQRHCIQRLYCKPEANARQSALAASRWSHYRTGSARLITYFAMLGMCSAMGAFQLFHHQSSQLPDHIAPLPALAAGNANTSQLHYIFASQGLFSITTNPTPIPFGNQFGSIAAADWQCTDQADSAGLLDNWDGMTPIWRAYLSDISDEVRDRVAISAPVFNMAGDLIAADEAGFYSFAGWLNPVRYNQDGVAIAGDTRVWTGSVNGGFASGDDCSGWSTQFAPASFGNLTKSSGAGEINDGFTGCNFALRLYCISPAVELEAEVTSSQVVHAGWSGDGPASNAVDSTKQLARQGNGPATALTMDNLINAQGGIQGIRFKIADAVFPQLLSPDDFHFQFSPTGAFDASQHPPESWPTAPSPSSLTSNPISNSSETQVDILWPADSIANRWLRVTIQATPMTGLPEPEVFYLGHLLGETTGPEGSIYTVSFADITSIRADVGSMVDSSSMSDINKDGSVSFADISAMRGNIGYQLTNIAIP